MKHIKGFSILVIIGICFGTIWIIQSRSSTQSVSDVITKQAPHLGPMGHILLTNLKDATVIAPDRPHDPFEVSSPDKKTRITRTRSFKVSTNSLGFRGKEVSPIKDKKRILCIGDSVTFGWGVAEDESYPALLEDLIDYEVINAGVPAMKPEHIVNYTNSILRQTNPDLVLLAMRPNWMTPRPIEVFARNIQDIKSQIQPIPLGIILPPIASFDPLGRQHSEQEVKEIKQRLSRIPILDMTPVFDKNMPESGVYLKIVGPMQEVIDRQSGEVLTKGTTPIPGPNQPTLAPEVVKLFEDSPSIQEPLFFDGGHPDKEGFIVFADEVAKWISIQGW
jgi:lysophospholipase L1-like esterase